MSAQLPQPVVKALKDQPALAVALMASGLVAIRLFAVANYRVDVALALLASSGPANVLLGTAFAMVPFLAPLLFIQVGRETLARARSKRPFAIGVIALGLIAAALAAATPLFMLIFIGLVIGGVLLFQRRGRVVQVVLSSREEYWITVAVWPVFILFASIVTQPWLAPEAITFSATPVVGYVASTDSRWTHILQDSPRVVLVVETDSITNRQLCWLRPSALTVTSTDLTRPVPLPPCPK